MSLYYFDVYDDGRILHDGFGQEMESRQEARDQAVGVLSDLASHKIPDHELQRFAIHVRDDQSRSVYGATMVFQGSWPIEGGPGWEPSTDPDGRTWLSDHGVLAKLRAETLARTHETVESTRRLAASCRAASGDLQETIRDTRDRIAMSRKVLAS